jgi:hypothetical protein
MPPTSRGTYAAKNFAVRLIVNGSTVLYASNYTAYELCPFRNTSSCRRPQSVWASTWSLIQVDGDQGSQYKKKQENPSLWALQLHGHLLQVLPDLAAHLVASNGTVLCTLQASSLYKEQSVYTKSQLELNEQNEWAPLHLPLPPEYQSLSFISSVDDIYVLSNGQVVDLYPEPSVIDQSVPVTIPVGGVIAVLLLMLLTTLYLSFHERKALKARETELLRRISEANGLEVGQEGQAKGTGVNSAAASSIQLVDVNLFASRQKKSKSSG